MRTTTIMLIILVTCQIAVAQWTESAMAACQDQEFNRKVNKLLNYSVDVISVDELQQTYDNYLILDTRELPEYLVSHLPAAIHLGYDQVNWSRLDTIDREQPILVYCSIGYRSEKIGEKLLERGFTNIRNLYGSIFEWANCGHELVDPRGRVTREVHTYNKRWSKWMNNPDYKKVY